MHQNLHDPTHPQPVVPAVTLPPSHRATGRRLPNASCTDQIGRWYGRWVGGTFSDTGWESTFSHRCENGPSTTIPVSVSDCSVEYL